METNDRIKGSLLGLAWGDVLGCPVESWSESEIQRVYGTYNELPTIYALDRICADPVVLKHLRPLGLHSDDTQQALALILVALNSPKAFSLSVWSDLLVAGMKAKAWRGYGRNFRSAVSNLSKGRSPRQAGSSSAGIGAAMRITPLGALYRDNLDELANVAMESSLVTHGDIRAASMAFAAAWASARLIAGESATSVAETLPQAVEDVERAWIDGHTDWPIDRTAGHLVSEVLATFLPRRDDPLPKFREALSSFAKPYLADGIFDGHVNQGFVLLGGVHAIATALRTDATPMAVLTDIIQLGHDTDTVAAIAGGILGARFGTGWFPMDRLLDAQRLERYAEALIERHASPETQDEFIAAEAAWTRREVAFQSELLEAHK